MSVSCLLLQRWAIFADSPAGYKVVGAHHLALTGQAFSEQDIMSGDAAEPES